MDEINKIKAENAAKQEAAMKEADSAGTEETGGEQHYIGNEVVPKFEEMIEGEYDDV